MIWAVERAPPLSPRTVRLVTVFGVIPGLYVFMGRLQEFPYPLFEWFLIATVFQIQTEVN